MLRRCGCERPRDDRQARQGVQNDTLGHRGRTGDPLYKARRTLRTRNQLLTDKQRTRLDTVFGDDAHLSVEVTWRIYQSIIDAYRDTDRTAGPRHWHASSTPSGPGSPPGSKNWPSSDGPCTDAATTSWPGSSTPAPRTAPLRPSVSIGVAGLGLAGRVVSVPGNTKDKGRHAVGRDTAGRSAGHETGHHVTATREVNCPPTRRLG
jgi:Transposase